MFDGFVWCDFFVRWLREEGKECMKGDDDDDDDDDDLKYSYSSKLFLVLKNSSLPNMTPTQTHLRRY